MSTLITISLAQEAGQQDEIMATYKHLNYYPTKQSTPWRCIMPLAVLLLCISGCASMPRSSNLGGIYNPLVQHEDIYRNPVILIPGILGSKLVEQSSNTVVWGDFGFRNAGLGPESGAGMPALPMENGKELWQLRDQVLPRGTLDRVRVNFGGWPFELNAYAYILGILGVGGYRDSQLAQSGAVDWGDQHFTCFQFPYDWRRDLVETANELDRFIQEKKAYVEREIQRRFGVTRHDVKFDIVAHSMGGLLTR